MINIYKKTISMLLCFTILFSFSVSNYVLANENSNYIENLKNNVTILENTDKISKVLIESENGKCISSLDKETNNITVETFEKYGNEDVNTVYKAKLDSFEEDKISGKLIDEKSGEVYPIGEDQTNNSGRQKRFVWALALAPEVIAALQALAATATTVAAIGATWTVGKSIANELKKEKNYKYFAAAISRDDKVAIGPPLTTAEAKSAVLSGANVLARTKSDAYSLAKSCGGAVRKSEIHGSRPNYLEHYHPKMKPKVHIFFWSN